MCVTKSMRYFTHLPLSCVHFFTIRNSLAHRHTHTHKQEIVYWYICVLHGYVYIRSNKPTLTNNAAIIIVYTLKSLFWCAPLYEPYTHETDNICSRKWLQYTPRTRSLHQHNKYMSTRAYIIYSIICIARLVFAVCNNPARHTRVCFAIAWTEGKMSPIRDVDGAASTKRRCR